MPGKPNDKIWATMVQKHGSEEAAINWYKSIGAKGGKAKVPKGFGVNKELARTAGRLGGLKSRRKYE